MEPVVELAVRVSALLSFVRESLPQARNLTEALLQWDEVEQIAARDYSVLRTIQEFAEPEHSLPVSKLPKWLAWLDQGESDPLGGFPSEADAAAHFAGTLRSCLQELQKILPEDARRFKEVRPSVNQLATWMRPVEVVVTREEVGERVANALLADKTLVPKAAKALHYMPQLIKKLADLKGEPYCLWLDKSRRELRDECRESGMAVPFSFVLSDELDEIRWSRQRRLRGFAEQLKLPQEKPQLPREQAYQDCLFGVALSGGGIRSATFSLGVLQGMADRNMLPFIDYLSTVSGGGYIGSWLIAWVKRRGSIGAVQESLRGSATSLPNPSSCAARKKIVAPPPDVKQNSDPRAEHVRPIRLLREYARYLAPQAGLFSADSWTVVSTWLRNTALSLTVLILALASLLLLPRSAVYLLVMLPHWLTWMPRDQAWPILLAGAPLWAACVTVGFFNLRPFHYWRNPSRPLGGRGDSEAIVTGSVLLLIVAGAFCLLAALWSFGGYEYPSWAALWSGVLFLIGVVLIALFSSTLTPKERILKKGSLLFQMVCAPFCARRRAVF